MSQNGLLMVWALSNYAVLVNRGKCANIHKSATLPTFSSKIASC